MKVEVDFPADFESDRALSIHLGRLTRGKDHVMRLFFRPDGTVIAVVPQSALDDGSIVPFKASDDLHLAGLWIKI